MESSNFQFPRFVDEDKKNWVWDLAKGYDGEIVVSLYSSVDAGTPRVQVDTCTRAPSVEEISDAVETALSILEGEYSLGAYEQGEQLRTADIEVEW